MTSRSDGLGPQKDPNSGRTRVESGPAGTHRPTTRRGSGIAQPSVPRARCPECLARRQTEVVERHRHQRARQKGARERPDRIKRLTKTVGSAAQFGWGEVADQRIPRRAPDSLTDSIDETRDEN